LPASSRALDAGAGELKNQKYCGHLEYEYHVADRGLEI